MAGMTNIEWATWVTAAGTILAAGSAVGLAWWSHKIGVRSNDRRDWQQARGFVLRDLDETRRLLIINNLRPEALDSPDLYGTIVNAVDKHSQLSDALTAGNMLNNRRQGIPAARDQIDALLTRLDRWIDYVRKAKPSEALDEPKPG
jgi:hypothetical protein